MAREKKNNSREGNAAPEPRDGAGFQPFDLLYPALIALLVAIAYSNSLNGEFIFDEELHIKKNEEMKELWPPTKSAFARTQITRPLVGYSLAINYAISGNERGGESSWHVFNILMHAFAALALYGLVWRTLRTARLRETFGSSAKYLGFAIAAIWAVHPLNTQAVDYVIQRSEVMMGLFYLLTLYCLNRANNSRIWFLWLCASVVSCALGMACKQVMFTAPIMAIVYDLIFLRPERKAREVKTAPEAARITAFAAMFVSWSIIFLTLHYAPEEKSSGASARMTALQYALTQFGVILHYLRLSVVPWPLCLDYGWPIAKSPLQFVPQMIVIVALVAGMFRALFKRPALGFAMLWFFLILAPTSTIFPINDPIFEHRMYLSLAGLVAIVVCACSSKLGRDPIIGRVAVVITLAVLATLTIRRNMDYATALSIWSDTIKKAPNNERALLNYGSSLDKKGKHEEALKYFRMAEKAELEQFSAGQRKDQNSAQTLTNVAAALDAQGDVNTALVYYQKAVAADDTKVDALSGLANVLAKLGKFEEAFKYFQLALKIDPNEPTTHNLLGATYGDVGKHDEARREYELAIKLNPKFADAYNNLATSYAQRKDFQEALRLYTMAVQLKPDYPEALTNLGLCYHNLKQPENAERAYIKALSLKQNNRDAHFNYGLLLESKGSLQQAAEHFEIALQLRSDDIELHRHLASIYLKLGRSEDAQRHSQFLKK